MKISGSKLRPGRHVRSGDSFGFVFRGLGFGFRVGAFLVAVESERFLRFFRREFRYVVVREFFKFRERLLRFGFHFYGYGSYGRFRLVGSLRHFLVDLGEKFRGESRHLGDSREFLAEFRIHHS